MDTRTKRTLLTAFNIKRAALHVDLQGSYYCFDLSGSRYQPSESVQNAFQVVDGFSQALRQESRNVQNLWVVRDYDTTVKMTTVNNFQPSCAQRGFIEVHPEESELVFIKEKEDSFENLELKEYVEIEDIEVLFVDGVSARACISQTVLGGLESCKNLHIVVIKDGIDWPTGHIDDIESEIKTNNPRLHFSTTAEVMSCLPDCPN